MPRPSTCYPPATLLALTLFLLAAPAEASPLTIEAAIETALKHSSEMIVAREDMVLVDVDYMDALSAILPRVDISANAGGNTSVRRFNEFLLNPVTGDPVDVQSPTFSQANFGLGASVRQLLFDGGRWWTIIKRVDDLEASRRAALRGVQNDVRAKTTRAFYELAKADGAVTTIEEQVDLAQAQLDRAKAMVAAGRGTARDVATAVRDLAADQINRENRLVARSQAVAALNLQLGREANTAVELVLSEDVQTSSVVSVDLPSRANLVDTTMSNHPDLLQMRAQIEAANKDVDVSAADYWPVVTIEGSYRRGSRRPDRVYADPTENFTAAIDLVVRWNIFEGRATTARVARARVALRKQLAQLEDLSRRATSNVDLAVADLEKQVRIYLLSQRGVEAAKEAVRLAQGMYDAGRGTALELRDAQSGLTMAKLSAIDARYEIEVGKEELQKAVGVSLSEVQ